jgi:hypothetical protein
MIGETERLRRAERDVDPVRRPVRRLRHLMKNCFYSP